MFFRKKKPEKKIVIDKFDEIVKCKNEISKLEGALDILRTTSHRDYYLEYIKVGVYDCFFEESNEVKIPSFIKNKAADLLTDFLSCELKELKSTYETKKLLILSKVD